MATGIPAGERRLRGLWRGPSARLQVRRFEFATRWRSFVELAVMVLAEIILENTRVLADLAQPTDAEENISWPCTQLVCKREYY